MEGCIEDTYLGQTWHQLLHGIHALQVGRIVQRSEVGTLLKGLQHLISENDRLVELLSTVHHTVTDGINLVETLNHTDLRVCQQ